NNAVELFRCNATLLQAQHDLPCAETAINENLAMIGCDQRTISRAAAAKHGQAEHGSQDSRVISVNANTNRFESGWLKKLRARQTASRFRKISDRKTILFGVAIVSIDPFDSPVP